MNVGKFLDVLRRLPLDAPILISDVERAGTAKIKGIEEINGEVHLTTTHWTRPSITLDEVRAHIVAALSSAGIEKQRQAFSVLMPDVRLLRNQGFSFHQITKLLGEGGFSLKQSTVRNYYNEILMDYIEAGMRQTDDFMAVLDEIENLTRDYRKDEQHMAPQPADESALDFPPAEGLKGLRCLPMQPAIKTLPRRDGVPEVVYSDGLLEHPAIPGLMLSLSERLNWSLLEIHENGQTRLETVHEKIFRVKWTTPIPRTPSASSADFVQMTAKFA